MNPGRFQPIARRFSCASEVPIGDEFAYHCLKCDGVIHSMPDDGASCRCGCVRIDVDYHRLLIKDFNSFEVLSKPR